MGNHFFALKGKLNMSFVLMVIQLVPTLLMRVRILHGMPNTKCSSGETWRDALALDASILYGCVGSTPTSSTNSKYASIA